MLDLQAFAPWDKFAFSSLKGAFASLKGAFALRDINSHLHLYKVHLHYEIKIWIYILVGAFAS